MKYLSLFLLFLLMSCKESSLLSFYESSLMTDIQNNNYDYYIIIPHAGCPGCVSDAEDFLIRNLNNSKYLFIITNYTSEKYLVLKLGAYVLKCQNVILDSTNKYYAKKFEENIYPISLFLDKNKIKKITIGVPNDLK